MEIRLRYGALLFESNAHCFASPVCFSNWYYVRKVNPRRAEADEFSSFFDVYRSEYLGNHLGDLIPPQPSNEGIRRKENKGWRAGVWITLWLWHF
jgi:hypothetical protein